MEIDEQPKKVPTMSKCSTASKVVIKVYIDYKTWPQAKIWVDYTAWRSQCWIHHQTTLLYDGERMSPKSWTLSYFLLELLSWKKLKFLGQKAKFIHLYYLLFWWGRGSGVTYICRGDEAYENDIININVTYLRKDMFDTNVTCFENIG